jgi:hypothetical protein
MKLTGLSFACFLFTGCMTSPPAVDSNQGATSQAAERLQPSSHMGATSGGASVSPGPAESQALVQVRFVIAEMSRSTAQEIFGATDTSGATFGAGLAPDLEALAQTHADIEVRSRLRVLVHSGGVASAANVTPETYTQDYKIENGAARAVLGRLEEGYWVDAVPTFAAGDNRVEIDLTRRRSTINRPIPERSVELPGWPTPVTIQLPALDTQSAKSQVSLELGQSHAFCFDSMRTAPEQPRALVAVMSVDRANR